MAIRTPLLLLASAALCAGLILRLHCTVRVQVVTVGPLDRRRRFPAACHAEARAATKQLTATRLLVSVAIPHGCAVNSCSCARVTLACCVVRACPGAVCCAHMQ